MKHVIVSYLQNIYTCILHGEEKQKYFFYQSVKSINQENNDWLLKYIALSWANQCGSLKPCIKLSYSQIVSPKQLISDIGRVNIGEGAVPISHVSLILGYGIILGFLRNAYFFKKWSGSGLSNTCPLFSIDNSIFDSILQKWPLFGLLLWSVCVIFCFGLRICANLALFLFSAAVAVLGFLLLLPSF